MVCQSVLEDNPQAFASGLSPIREDSHGINNLCHIDPCRPCISHGSQLEKTRHLQGFSNNKGADQPARPCSLVSAFVICFMEIIISRLAISEFQDFS